MTPGAPPHAERLLAAYDAQLRGAAEMLSTTGHDRAGPLWRAKFDSRGFVTYPSLGDWTGAALDTLIAETIEHYAADPRIETVEWKTRGHDRPDDLPDRLIRQGFAPEEQETVMIGEARLLAEPVPLPEGIRLRRIDTAPDPHAVLLRAAEAQSRAFGFAFGVQDFIRRLEKHPDLVEIWIAESADEVVCVGRLEVVPDSEFAGLWGGGTLPEWRGRGIYRALTAARAASAVARGLRFLQSDCTALSRPILERSGLRPVTTTTPYVWTRSG